MSIQTTKFELLKLLVVALKLIKCPQTKRKVEIFFMLPFYNRKNCQVASMMYKFDGKWSGMLIKLKKSKNYYTFVSQNRLIKPVVNGNRET